MNLKESRQFFLIGIILLVFAVMVQNSIAEAGSPMKMQVYNPGEKSVFPVTSVLLIGDNESVLIDAQFEKKDAEALVEMIKASNTDLKYIYISHSDPDYYFGLETLLESFPDTKVISTPQTAYVIEMTKNKKLEIWKDVLKENVPKKVVTPESIQEDYFELEGNLIEIKGLESNPDQTYLWIPSLKTVAGGINVVDGLHVWMADAQKSEDQFRWIATLKEMKTLPIQRLIPGHYMEESKMFGMFSPQSIDFTLGYLQNFIAKKEKYENRIDFTEAILQEYPLLKGKDSLELSSKVLYGEMNWETIKSYPAIGHQIDIHCDKMVFHLIIKNDKEMSVASVSETGKDITDIVLYKAFEIAPQVYMVFWHEPKTGANVVHIQDFKNNIAYLNIANSDGSFLNLQGTLKLLDLQK